MASSCPAVPSAHRPQASAAHSSRARRASALWKLLSARGTMPPAPHPAGLQVRPGSSPRSRGKSLSSLLTPQEVFPGRASQDVHSRTLPQARRPRGGAWRREWAGEEGGPLSTVACWPCSEVKGKMEGIWSHREVRPASCSGDRLSRGGWGGRRGDGGGWGPAALLFNQRCVALQTQPRPSLLTCAG